MSDDELPPGWTKMESKSRPGMYYYYNPSTAESLWEKPSMASTRTATASHILVKHRGSRNPTSWKEKNITRTKEEAIDILSQLRERIESGEDFATIASTESDCSSAKRGGDLGSFGPGKMQKPFEDATFALEVGELSGIVTTDSGVHIILRTG